MVVVSETKNTGHRTRAARYKKGSDTEKQTTASLPEEVGPTKIQGMGLRMIAWSESLWGKGPKRSAINVLISNTNFSKEPIEVRSFRLHINIVHAVELH